MKKERLVDVDIVQLSPRGHGLGYFECEGGVPRPVEVPFTLPNEAVVASLKGRKSGVYRSELCELRVSSAHRVRPVCSHFGLCGGCRWQHITYSDQLAEKQSRIVKLFGNLLEDTTMYPIVPCGVEWRYRNKMEFSFSSDRKGNQFLGLMQESGRGKVVDLKECFLCNPWCLQAIDCVRKWWKKEGLSAFHPRSGGGVLRTLTLREGIRTGDRLINLTVTDDVRDPITRSQIGRLVQMFVETLMPHRGRLSQFLTVHQAIRRKPTRLYEMHLSGPEYLEEQLVVDRELYTFQVSPQAFFQPNSLQAEKLYSLVAELADLASDSTVYDLFCGTGALGITLARRVKEVIGIEIAPESVLDARENGCRNHLENFSVYQGDVPHVLETIQKAGSHAVPDVVVIDPPRSGLTPKALEQLVCLQAPKIVYVSCNPATQADNVNALCAKGYTLTALQPIDQFPQTLHVETIGVLQLRAR